MAIGPGRPFRSPRPPASPSRSNPPVSGSSISRTVWSTASGQRPTRSWRRSVTGWRWFRPSTTSCPSMAETAARGVGATAARVTLQLGDGTERSVSWPPGEAIDDPTFSLPVGHADELIGAIAIVKPPNEPLRPAERALLEDLAGNAGLALHNVRLASDLGAKAEELAAQTAEIERSRERLVTARDTQRRRLERELRDGVGTQLAAIRDEIGSDAERVESRARGRRGVARRSRRSGQRRPRRAARRRPRHLPSAAERQGTRRRARRARAQDRCLGHVRPGSRGRPTVRACGGERGLLLLRPGVAERRAARARARRPRSISDPTTTAIRFVIHDDGPGFEVSTTDAGEGMQIMQDRIAALAGELVIESTRGRGTTVTGRVPARVMEASPA